MANYLTQFQTIKSACDHLVIAGKSSLFEFNSFLFFFLFFLLDLNLLLGGWDRGMFFLYC